MQEENATQHHAWPNDDFLSKLNWLLSNLHYLDTKISEKKERVKERKREKKRKNNVSTCVTHVTHVTHVTNKQKKQNIYINKNKLTEKIIFCFNFGHNFPNGCVPCSLLP